MRHDPEIKKQWIQRLKAFETEDLPISQFCKKHDLKEHRFYYWRDKLKQKTPIKKAELPLKFIPVKTTHQESVNTLINAHDADRVSITMSIDGTIKNTHIEIKAFIHHD